MNGEYEIDKETFKELDLASQNWMMFKTYNSDRKKNDARLQKIECDLALKTDQSEFVNLAKKFDRRKKVDTAAAGTGGLIGGFLSMLTFGWIK